MNINTHDVTFVQINLEAWNNLRDSQDGEQIDDLIFFTIGKNISINVVRGAVRCEADTLRLYVAEAHALVKGLIFYIFSIFFIFLCFFPLIFS